MDHLPPLCLENASVLTEEGLVTAPVSLAGGVVTSDGGRGVDASGYLILPGIVDLHGDGFEHHMAPRRGAQSDPVLGLRATEAELAANGITTAVLAQFYSWEGGMRAPEFAARMAEALDHLAAATDLHLQLRVETHLLDEFGAVEALINRHAIPYVVWNDHLPHAALAKGKRPPRLTGQALKSGRSPEAHLAYLQALHARGPEVPDALATLSARLRARGVRLGSHDDQTPETRAGFRAMGADICEFPETRAAAEAARAQGDAVIMGAPNVVRGGSHDGKIAAGDLIEDGLVDALVSDYHYPALHRAALTLWDRGMALERAWGLVSGGPARVMGWSDRGRIAPGLRADLVVMEAESRRIEGVFAGGAATYLCGALAARMVGG